jgi:hypothetical protein
MCPKMVLFAAEMERLIDEMGGADRVSNGQLWAAVARGLGVNTSRTANAPVQLRKTWQQLRAQQASGSADGSGAIDEQGGGEARQEAAETEDASGEEEALSLE